MTANLAADYVVLGSNPLPAGAVLHYAVRLRNLLAALDREIVDTALLGDRECDLLRAERQEVDRSREFLHRRVGMVLELDGRRGRGLALLDAFGDELGTAEHSDSSSVGPGAATPGDEPTVEDQPGAPCSGDSHGAPGVGGDGR